MHAPTSLRQIPQLPVTSTVCLVAMAMFVVSLTVSADAFVLDGRAFFAEPWRMLTGALIHGHIFHLAFNVACVWYFGSAIELQLGHGKTALLYTVLALGSSLAEIALDSGGSGLSGVSYGLFTFVWVTGDSAPRLSGLLDRTLIIALTTWVFVAFTLEQLGLAQAASVSQACGGTMGALAGAAFVSYRGRRVIALVSIGIVLVAAFMAIGPWRPRLRQGSPSLLPPIVWPSRT